MSDRGVDGRIEFTMAPIGPSRLTKSVSDHLDIVHKRSTSRSDKATFASLMRSLFLQVRR